MLFRSPVNDRHHSGSDNERLREALAKLVMTAQLLWQNAAGCAVNHHGHDFQELGPPGWLADCEKDIVAARTSLNSTDRQTSDDVGRFRALLEEELVWHEERDKSLSKQPQSNQTVWRRAEHQERIDVIRAALKGPASEAGR